MAKQALGRGLGALMGGISGAAKPPAVSPVAAPAASAPPAVQTTTGEQIQRIPIAQIQPCAFQPRKDFSEDSIQELANSIREQGIIQPLVVRRNNGVYELIAGERRWRAAKVANLAEVPVIVREADDRKVLELALIENLQRENLNPIEEALGYSRLIKEFSLTQEQAAARVGKGRVTVANVLRLLQLHPDVQGYLRTGRLTFGHARAILGATHQDAQKELAETVIRENLSVRSTEELVARRTETLPQPHTNGTAAPKSASAAYVMDAHVAALQNKLQERFGTKVLLRYRKGKGAVEIRFFSDDDLERILELTGVPTD